MWSEHSPRHTKFNFSLSYSNLHFPNNFHQNWAKIAKVSYQGGCRVGGWSGLNTAPGTPNFILLLVILIYISPPIFNKIGPKLPNLAIRVVVGYVGRVVGVV